jgi:phosphoglycerate dehydrogenase-like enzyme
VTDPEPLPPDHRLWRAPNLLLTPHVSGGYHFPETLERIVRISADNLAAFVQHRPMTSVVDFQTGYRRI